IFDGLPDCDRGLMDEKENALHVQLPSALTGFEGSEARHGQIYKIMRFDDALNIIRERQIDFPICGDLPELTYLTPCDDANRPVEWNRVDGELERPVALRNDELAGGPAEVDLFVQADVLKLAMRQHPQHGHLLA